jgi:rod shape determining protein RodA
MNSFKKDEQITGKIDWLTVLIYLILVFFGWATIYSAVYQEDEGNIFSTAIRSGKQFQWMIASLIIGFIILIIDSKFFSTFAYVIYAVMLVILVGVIFFGVEVKGQNNWIRFGGFQMQPSEMAKFVTCLAVAKYISTLNVDIRKWKFKWRVFAIIFLPMLLVLVQGDAGSAIVFTALILALFREGLESYFLVIGTTVAILSVLALLIPKFIFSGILLAIAIFLAYYNWRNKTAVKWVLGIWLISSLYIFSVDLAFSKLKSHQKDRINVLIGKGGNDWNIRQSMIAIGSGGFVGKGYLNGTQTKLKFVPEQSTDFIFSSIGEEFGFIGSAVLVLIFVALFFRLLFMAERQRSRFSRVYGYCVVSILFFHFLINIGMAIGVAPVIGIPLPFISYGGSSLLSFTILLFLFIRMDSQRLESFR